MTLESPIILPPTTPDYPKVLHRCAEDGCPPTVTAWGSLRPLAGKLLGFFCSVRTPGAVILKIYDLAQTLRDANQTIIGGFQSPMEKEFLDFLLRGTAPVVVCPARGISPMRIPKAWRGPMEEGRLLILSFCNAGIRRPTSATAARRNVLVVALADRLLVPYAEPAARSSNFAERPRPKASRCLRCPHPAMHTLLTSAQRRFPQTAFPPFGGAHRPSVGCSRGGRSRHRRWPQPNRPVTWAPSPPEAPRVRQKGPAPP